MEFENIQKKIQIVVSRYNENLTWLIPFKQISIVYNKGDNSPILNAQDARGPESEPLFRNACI